MEVLGLAGVVDLVLTRACAVCRRPGGSVCRSCATELLASVVGFGPPRAVRPRPCPPGLPPCTASAPYAGPVATLVSAYKDEDRRDVRQPLSILLASALRAALSSGPVPVEGPGRRGPLLLVPAPGRRSTRRRRGADPLGELARAALSLLDTDSRSVDDVHRGVGARTRDPSGDGCAAGAAGVVQMALVPLLRHTRAVRDQAGLSSDERRDNLADAVAVVPGTDLSGRVCLLLDDVVTTGVTLAESARALSRAGGVVIGAATVCATSRVAAPDARLSRGARVG